MKDAARYRIFKSYSLLIAGSIVLVMLLMFLVVSRSNYNTAIYRQLERLQSDAAELEEVMDRLATVASLVNSSDELLNIFAQLESDSTNGNYFNDNLMNSIRAGSVLETINNISSPVLRVCVFNDYGDYVSAGLMYVDESCAERTLSKPQLQVYRDALEGSGNGHALIGPHSDWWANSDVRIISYITPFSSIYSDVSYGYVDIQVDYQEFLDMKFMRQNQDGAQYILVNSYGQAVLRPEEISNKDAGKLYRAMMERADRGLDMHDSNTVSGMGVNVFASHIESANWTLLRVVPNGTLYRPYLLGYFSMLIGGVVLLVVLLKIAYSMADRVSKPLHEFAESIDQITLDNMTMPRLPEGYYSMDELDVLDRSFRRMLKKLDYSIGLEMKAYLNALQSQMDPHFLYNMLTVITETADCDGSAQTVDICQRLSKMLRYMANYDSNQVTLQQETEQLRTYLELMHDRYGDHFRFEINEDADMREISVPRMILQPLAENCFQHGFRKVRPPWVIRVNMRIENGRWMVEIRDNGSGITSKEVEGIYRRVNEFSENVARNYQQLRIGGLGLVNTLLRMKLTQKEAMIFKIESPPDGGTMITIGGST